MNANPEERALNDEIARLEAELQLARARRDQLAHPHPPTPTPTTFPSSLIPLPNPTNDNALHPPPTPHALLLLSDSALPLGTFAYSSGLESYLQHHRTAPHPPPSLPHFLHLSLASLSSTSLPHLIATHDSPAHLPHWDHSLDAATPCAVARRASLAQGRALLSVWERGLRAAQAQSRESAAAATALGIFAARLKPSPVTSTSASAANGHFAPLWALVSLALGLSLPQAVYVFLFSHARAVLSAGVRAGVLGPYQAQAWLASAWLRGEIEGVVSADWDTPVEEAGQRVPVMDLWVGRHEVLYSRIFNS